MEEDKEKSHVRAMAVVLVVVFLVGIFMGYYIWGYRKQQHPDYKDMLKQTISYIATLEEKNQALTSKVGTLENDVLSLKKQQEISGEKSAALPDRMAVLEKENADLKASLKAQEGLIQENLQLRQKVQALVEQMNTGSRRPAENLPAPSPAQPPGASGF
jgi:chromosome segregation ATPase